MSDLGGLDVFTPIDAATGKRLRFPRDWVEVLEGNPYRRILGHRAIVLIGESTFEVIGRECTLPGCNCDAEIRDYAPSPVADRTGPAADAGGRV